MMKRKVLLKGCAIGGAVILLSVLAMYLGLSRYYIDGFSYGTWINGIYCTGKSIHEVNDALLEQCHYEGLTITDSDGKSYHILPNEVALTFSYEESLSLYLEKQNPYLWIDNLAEKSKKRRLTPVVHYDKEAYEAKINELPIWQKKAEEERRVAIQKGSAGYALINEREHVLNEGLARELIKEAFDGFETEIDLEQAGCYSDLPLTAEMEETLSMWEKVSAYQDCGIIYQMGEEQVPLDAGIVCDFLLLDENGSFVTDENGLLCTDKEKVYEFVERLAKEYDTVGGVRTFKATRGDTVTVEGGLYGNKLDKKAEKEYLLDAFLSGKREVHTPEYTQMGQKQGKDDIGDTYIEVDMTEQMLYYYVDGKQEIATPVVTGNTSRKRGTPTGTNFVYAKQRNRILRGPGYESFVKYWIPVNRGIGIHDASWRSKYGGTIYQTDGSHGCINTPSEEVSRLYDMVEIGTPCVMFY